MAQRQFAMNDAPVAPSDAHSGNVPLGSEVRHNALGGPFCDPKALGDVA